MVWGLLENQGGVMKLLRRWKLAKRFAAEKALKRRLSVSGLNHTNNFKQPLQW